MFYAHIILAKKGPLARIWLAAHWDKKITKAHVFETNIEKSIEGIMQPKVKLALRTSGHLLLGVVRIYSRKAKYLLADCNEAFVKIKMAFRPGMVDLPEGHREANVNAITLPEVFHDFDTALPELNDIDIEAQFSINQSRADEITMREDYGSLSLSLHDDGFGDIGFEGDTPDLMRGSLETNINDQLFEDEIVTDVNEGNASKIQLDETELTTTRLKEGDSFGEDFGHPQLFEDDLFGEPPLTTMDSKVESAQVIAEELDDDGDNFNVGAPSSDSSRANSPVSAHEIDDAHRKDEDGNEATDNAGKEDAPLDQSHFSRNEDESFALAPIDASAYKGITKSKRKRKLIVDEVKNISGEEMKAQLANTSDIVTTLDLAPPTKRLMYWKETGGVEKLFSLPSRSIPARALFLNYHRHLVSHFTQLEDFSSLGPSDVLALDQIQNENETQSMINNKRGRKRKQELQNASHQSQADALRDQSIAAPEQIREHEDSLKSQVSLDIGTSRHESLLPIAESKGFDGDHSPGPLFSLNDISGIENLNDIPLTPGNIHHGMDAGDDFHPGNLTPAELHHGGITPHHTGIESIESIPNLPVDQISSILNEAENMTSNRALSQLHNTNQSCDIAPDWNDYDFPSSFIVQSTAEEQMENETNEQFEERVLNKRAAQLFYAVKTHLVKQDNLLLSELTIRNTRKQAAQKFYSLLVLKKFRALNIAQTLPYSDIVISRGALFENPSL